MLNARNPFLRIAIVAFIILLAIVVTFVRKKIISKLDPNQKKIFLIVGILGVIGIVIAAVLIIYLYLTVFF